MLSRAPMESRDVARPLDGDAPLRVMCDFEGRQLVSQTLSPIFYDSLFSPTKFIVLQKSCGVYLLVFPNHPVAAFEPF
jgi:hypothetical protein